MFTLYLRYTLDPNELRDFRAYVSAEIGPIRRSGCAFADYYYPTDFAGPTNEAHGLITRDAPVVRRARRRLD